MNDVDDWFRENEIETELEFRRLIDSNDPSLLHAQIGSELIDGYFPHDGDWGECKHLHRRSRHRYKPSGLN